MNAVRNSNRRIIVLGSIVACKTPRSTSKTRAQAREELYPASKSPWYWKINEIRLIKRIKIFCNKNLHEVLQLSNRIEYLFLPVFLCFCLWTSTWPSWREWTSPCQRCVLRWPVSSTCSLCWMADGTHWSASSWTASWTSRWLCSKNQFRVYEVCSVHNTKRVERKARKPDNTCGSGEKSYTILWSARRNGREVVPRRQRGCKMWFRDSVEMASNKRFWTKFSKIINESERNLNVTNDSWWDMYLC